MEQDKYEGGSMQVDSAPPAPAHMVKPKDQKFADDIVQKLSDDLGFPNWDTVWVMANASGKIYLTNTSPKIKHKNSPEHGVTLRRIDGTRWGFLDEFHTSSAIKSTHPHLSNCVVGVFRKVGRNWWSRENIEEVSFANTSTE